MHGITLKSYVTGFVISIVLSLLAYGLVVGHVMTGNALGGALLGLALIQFSAQTLCFLHVGMDKGSRWKMGTFIFTVGLLFVIVGGSIWIMNHLNYSMMASPEEMQHYIDSQRGF
jgi:cytochrome o ubiquinol oxidase operon protein cyoD